MNVVERTRQQLDPAGTIGARAVTITLCVGALLYALLQTWHGLGQISNPPIAIFALALLVAACLVLVVGSSPDRAPLRGPTHGLAISLGTAAIVAEAYGQYGTNAYIRDDWGPTALGILFVALGPYRPALEIAASGILAAILVGFIVLVEVGSFVTAAPTTAFVIAAMAPMVALCFAASMFSMGIVASIERFQKRSSEASRSLSREFRDEIARSVREDRVTILEREVLPFFGSVLSRESLTADDKVRARLIADSIRRVMVQEVDRSWLEAAIDLAGGPGGPGVAGIDSPNQVGASREIVSDHDRVATRMTTDQRTAIRALLVALIRVSGVERRDLRILLARVEGSCHARISAQLDLTDFVMRSTFSPYFAVLRAVFSNLEVDFVHSTLTLRFAYDHQ